MEHSSRTKDSRPRETVQMSKALSYLLRHGAEKAHLAIRPDGFAQVSDVVKVLGRGLDENKVKEIVRTCEKQRFALQEIDGKLWIRANQGHTMGVVEREKTYKKILDARDYPICVHGTSLAAWESIKRHGLSRMRRNEIHCAKAELGEAVSGMRFSSQVFIYIDLQLCLQNGIEWYESDNGVLLSPGIGPKGLIPTGFFSKVVDAKTKQALEYSPTFEIHGD